MSAAVAAACDCQTIGADPTMLRQCPTCFKIYRGDRRLASVSRIMSLWPQEPCSSCGWPIFSAHQAGCSVKANIDNARDRGSAVDALVTAYVKGALTRIPAGTRRDAVDLFMKVKTFLDKQAFVKREAQVLVADDSVGGVLDLKIDGIIIDLKCTYNVEPTHGIQVGGYFTLDAAMGDPQGAAILHVTERYPEARWIPLRVPDITADFLALRNAWAVVERRKKS